MPDLPPIGSLWLHRESGERRFVLYIGEGRVAYQYLHEPVGLHSRAYGEDWDLNSIWLAWQAKAVRIDREDA